MDHTRPRAVVGASIVVVLATVLAGCGGGGGAGPAWWGLQAEVGPESTVVPILVRVGSSSCHRFEGVTTVETDESVTCLLYTSPSPRD